VFHDRTCAMSEVAPVHCWPVEANGQHRFALGRIIDCSAAVLRAYANEQLATNPGVGLWECELDGDELTWSNEIYDMFGLPRDVTVTRAEALTYYSHHSREVMERLRAEAIKHKRSFVLDAEIWPRHGSRRCWMRVVAAPVCEHGEVVRLQGFKQIL
jgi:PAS domain-containing protein